MDNSDLIIHEIICISCPMGCHLKIRQRERSWLVSGNRCPRGETYGIQEMTDPRRMITTTVRVRGGVRPVVSVKTSQPVPKAKVFEVIRELAPLEFNAPIQAGEVLFSNLLGLGADILATRSVEAQGKNQTESRATTNAAFPVTNGIA